MKLLFVVHRYSPFPGGSEIYVQSMAEESLKRGHKVAVLTGEHKGDLNNVHVTSDPSIFNQGWDLVVVHGGDVSVQNWVLSQATEIQKYMKILYLIVLPSHSQVCINALKDCAYIGCSTVQDWEHCEKYNVLNKAVKIRHGIKLENCVGISGFKQKYNINKRMFLSCGGYWPNKAMIELSKIFEESKLNDSILVTTGYDNRMNLMPQRTENVLPLLIDDRTEVLSAIKDADCLIMHSYQEGFGLVLLEATINKTPWIAREIAGAKELKKYGQTYQTDDQLYNLLNTFNRNSTVIDNSYEYVLKNHLIQHTIDDIETLIKHA